MSWNLADLFELVVDAVPDREALVVPNAVGGARRQSYAELEDRANRLAHALEARGVDAGDKVGIYGYNSNEWIEAQFAAWKIRAVPINVNFRYVENELRYLFDNADLVALVHGAEFADRIAAVRGNCPLLRHCIAYDDGSGADVSVCDAEDYEAVLAAASSDRAFPERSDDDLYMLYTGGTTGMPKGVMWRHEDFFKATIGPLLTTATPPLEAETDLAERAVAAETVVSLFPLAPMMHGAAQWSSLASLLGGGTLVMSASRSFDPAEIWRIASDERVIGLTLVGDAMARPLVEALESLEDSVDLSSLFIISSGGAILSPSVKQRVAELLPHVLLFDAIGASETGLQGSGSGADDRGRPKFVLGEHTMVIDDDGNPTRPGDGRVGRLVRRGHIPLGYYKDEQKTADTFPTINGERWVVPGDMAITEADGTITLLGRGSVCINSGGEKIFPEEVELVLKGHPDVYDAVVVGVPDERWGERVAAVVTPRGDARPTVEELRDHARAVLSAYKLPKEVHLVDTMVRSPSGKADYRWARSVAASEHAPRPAAPA